MHSQVDHITGETFGFCTTCAKNAMKASFRERIILADGGYLRRMERFMIEHNYIPIQQLDAMRNDDVKIIASKYLNNCTGYICYNCDQYIIFDENAKRILFNYSTICSFGDVIDYKVLDHSVEYNIHSPETTNYSTSSKNALGRAIVGKALAGNVGGVIGGLTAKHNLTVENSGYSTYQNTTHDYNVVVILNKLGSPTITLTVGNNEEDMLTITNFLDQLIELAKK